MNRFRSQLRTMFGIRKQRRLTPAGPKPSVGSRIIAGDVRMTVKAGMSDALWEWLVKRGWREATYRPDRRRYNDLPSLWVSRLYDASPLERSRVLLEAKEAARRAEPVWLDPSAEESQDFA